MENIKVSIVVPTYNHERFIRQTVESMVMQETNFNFEILVGEDHSSDGTRAVLLDCEEKYPGKLRLFLRDMNMGGTKNIYDLLMHCRGEYIAITDGDDFWTDPHKLQRQADYLDAHPEDIAVAHNNEIVDYQGGHIGFRYDQEDAAKKLDRYYSFDDYNGKGHLFHLSTIVLRNIFINSQDQYAIIHRASNLVGDITIVYLLFDLSDIFIMKEVMSAYRYYSNAGGSNWVSLRKKDQIKSIKDNIRTFRAIEKYFAGRRSLAQKIALCIGNLLFQLFFRKNVNRQGVMDALSECTGKEILLGIVKFMQLVMAALVNKIRRIGKKGLSYD